MKTFHCWLENLQNLQGEPFIEQQWDNIRYDANRPLWRLKLKYRWDGYQIPAHERSYSLPNEFGSLEATQDKDYPQWFYLNGIGIAKSFQHQGYATNLIKKALEIIKNKGFKGIISDTKSRSKEGEGWWNSLKTRQVGEYQVLENI